MENRNTPKFIGAAVVLLFVLGLIITVSQMNSQPLQGYYEGTPNIVTTVEPYQATTVNPDMQHYSDETTGISLDVPKDWTRIIKDGFTTFIHQPSAAYVQIQKSAYVPNINNITEDTIREDLASAGAAFVSFAKDSNTGYTVLYQTQNNNIVYDWIEITRFDRQYIVRAVVCASDENYKKLEKEIMLTAESVQWNPLNPIPDDFVLTYNEFGNFEFAVPLTWAKGIQEGEYVARDPETGTEMRVGVYQSDATYDNVTQAKYAEYYGVGKTGFSVKEFSSNRNIVYAISSYVVNNINVYRIDYMLATGVYEYTISFVCPVDYYQEKTALFDTAIKLFRTF